MASYLLTGENLGFISNKLTSLRLSPSPPTILFVCPPSGPTLTNERWRTYRIAWISYPAVGEVPRISWLVQCRVRKAVRKKQDTIQETLSVVYIFGESEYLLRAESESEDRTTLENAIYGMHSLHTSSSQLDFSSRRRHCINSASPSFST